MSKDDFLSCLFLALEQTISDHYDILSRLQTGREMKIAQYIRREQDERVIYEDTSLGLEIHYNLKSKDILFRDHDNLQTVILSTTKTETDDLIRILQELSILQGEAVEVS